MKASCGGRGGVDDGRDDGELGGEDFTGTCDRLSNTFWHKLLEDFTSV
jgi:hypothetical protein